MAKSKRLNIRIEEDLYERVRDLAQREDRGVSEMARLIIVRYFRDAAGKPAPRRESGDGIF